jgi:hypothetical protein
VKEIYLELQSVPRWNSDVRAIKNNIFIMVLVGNICFFFS